MSTELVFGIESKYLHGLKINENLSEGKEGHDYLRHVLNTGHFEPRDKAEGEFNFKQIIPYVVFMDSEDKIFSYTRNGSESRLHNSISVGIGGHINPEDFQGSAMNMLLCNIERELDEEVMVFSPAGTWVSAKDLKVVGPEAIIYAGGDPFKHLTTVNEVHLGLLYYCFLLEGFSMTMGSEGKAGSFQTFEELNSKFDSLEAWMKIVLPFLG